MGKRVDGRLVCPECHGPMTDLELDLGLCETCYFTSVPDDERDCCTWCGGEGWDDECNEEGCYCLDGHPCGACGGSGLAKDQWIW